MELFGSMAEGLVSELLNERGFSDVHAVFNCVVRLSLALRPDEDPGVVSGGKKGGSGAPYSKVADGKIRVRCTNWGVGCEVSRRGGKEIGNCLTFTAAVCRRGALQGRRQGAREREEVVF